jgi:conjugative relaxase-like TrwC/TraI family protein
MTVSLRRMSAGNGYQYLLRSVAAGDGDRVLSTPLTRYYTEVGTPPGRWMGSGLRVLGGGRLLPGMPVTEEQIALLIGMGRDPVTGERLGRAYPAYESLAVRIKERVDRIDPQLAAVERAGEAQRIEAEEVALGVRHAVAGFDLTFSVPKSVSVLWGVADAMTQDRIVAAHHAAAEDVIDLLERKVAATRTGVADHDGAVAQVGVAGVAAVAFDHYDSRAGDPQLHTHVVLSAKVMTLLDGRWRSLDGRPLYASRTALSAHYNAILADRLSQDIGVVWELRERGADRNPQWEIAGIGEDLIREFSSRSREIDLEKDRLIAAYLAAHGRRPSEKKIVELRAQATLTTRPPKEIRSLADLTAEWRQRATRQLDTDVSAWVSSMKGRGPSAPMRAQEVPRALIEAIGVDVIEQVSVKRSVWTHWNLMAEASRQTMGLRFATAADREAIVGLIVETAEAGSISLTPPELVISPAAFQRPDGTSVFRPRHATKFSCKTVINAEASLLDRLQTKTAPSVTARVVGNALAELHRRRSGHGVPLLSSEQLAAVRQIATSGRQVDLLVGPAGAGKTTTMRGLRSIWTAAHGPHSVVGLAPSAAAAQVLAEDLGINCDNTAKWLYDHHRGRNRFEPAQLVIIDEASLAGTTTLDRITASAAQAGAKVLLVGDGYQLQPADAGGAFALLVDRHPDAAKLTEIHRFSHDWEKDASLMLRRGEPEVIATYAREDRIRQGSTDQMLDAAYQSWRTDLALGKASILLTESAHTVRALNERARVERLLLDGVDDQREVTLADGLHASVGDVVITRRNDRTLRTMTAMGRGAWVKNGDRWRITDIHNDGGILVRRSGSHRESRGRGSAVLPADYVRDHLDLGYAVTAHRAQGITVDTAHVVVTGSTTRENLYVSMTRGRDTNTAYVGLDEPDDIHITPELDGISAATVLYGVLQHVGDTLSAHQTLETQYETHSSIARVAAELETIAAAAQRDRFIELFRESGLTSEQHQTLVASTAFGPLIGALRRAEANHHHLAQLIPRVVAQHSLDTADDLAAVLRRRIDQASARPAPGARGKRPRLIAGLIPEPLGPMSDEDRAAIAQRKQLIQARAQALAEQAIQAQVPWVRPLGTPPSDPELCSRWRLNVATVSAYRDRYQVNSDLSLGGETTSEAQRADRRHALRAAREAAAIAEHAFPPGSAVGKNAAAELAL